MKILIAILFCIPSYGFIPPVQTLIKESLGNRKPYANLEMVIRHRITIPSTGEVVNLEEQIVTDSKGALFSWKVMGGEGSVYGTHERGQYLVGGSVTLATQSNIFLRYLTASNPDTLRDALMAERFINREQLNQYKPTFAPTGDPQLWDLKDNYVKHESIYLKRLGPNAPAIVVEGSDRRVYFSKRVLGIERLEWDGSSVVSWDFDQFTNFTTPGIYPKRFRFNIGGKEMVSSEMIAHRPAKPKLIADMRQLARVRRGMGSELQNALQVLLSYR